MLILNVVCEFEMFKSVCFYVLFDIFYQLDHLFDILKLIYSSFSFYYCWLWNCRGVIDIYFLAN